MPKRKRSSGKRTRGRVAKRVRRSYRRRIARKRRIGSVHHFRRLLDGNFGTWANGTANSGCFKIAGNGTHAPWVGTFYLGGISNVVSPNDFVNLFDQYRINKAVMRMYLKIDPGSNATGDVPRLYYYRDYDDSNIPASLNEIRENQKCRVKTFSPYRPVTLVWRPNCLATLFNSGLTSNYKPVFKQWLDIARNDTTHYGFKMGIDNLTNLAYRIEGEITLYFSTRQPR